MNSLRKTFLLVGIVTALSAWAFGYRCVCVTLDKDDCGGCEDSYCGGNVCAVRFDPARAVGWDQMLPGFSTEQVSGKLLVSEILPASPAERAGMRVGDEVISLDGMTVPLCRNEAKIWQNASAQHSVVIKRGRKSMAFEVSPIRLSTLLRRSVPPQLQNASLGAGGARLPQWSPFLSGLVISSTDNVARVLYVLPGSRAAENGINPGDIILAAAGRELTDVHQLEGADYRADLTLRVASPSGERTVHLTMNSVTEILAVLAHPTTTDSPARSEGF
jgi:S1-C subfamily serine protease